MTMSNAAAVSMPSDFVVTPTIDILLALLIVFVGMVPGRSKGAIASAPQPWLDQGRAPQDAVSLKTLHGAAEFRVNQQDVTRQGLPVRLAALYANRAQRVVFLHGDDRSSFRQVAEAVDISHGAGINQVGRITPTIAWGL